MSTSVAAGSILFPKHFVVPCCLEASTPSRCGQLALANTAPMHKLKLENDVSVNVIFLKKSLKSETKLGRSLRLRDLWLLLTSVAVRPWLPVTSSLLL